ncbi:MAG: PLP-dependent aspartate aminotransferase family protein [Desulforegulaceae bacterium]|nr:PLP-dependent aspartate aminotransferase family protein [Desulforegulaceae bacterium]
MDDFTKIINLDFDHNIIGGKRVSTINSPEYKASTILYNSHEEMILAEEGKYTGIYYGTNRMPNQRELEESLNILENASITRIFPSGISAIRHVLLAFLKSGDHILVCDNVYGPTKLLCKFFLPKFNIETDYLPSDSENIEDFIKENTKAVFIESPGSITFEIQDIEKTVQTAKKHNLITIMDNTWATPLYFKPLENGIDISIQSITKYISGNSDVLMGSASINKKHSDYFDKYYSLMGVCNSAKDCILALKGLKTLKLRLKEHEKTALYLASWLEKEKIIEKVLHPALKSHSQHGLYKKFFKGSSGLFGFIFKEEICFDKISKFLNSLKLFGLGFSWGGYKSLASAGKVRRDLSSEYKDKIIIRISTGLEDRKDLKNDLKNSIKKIT